MSAFNSLLDYGVTAPDPGPVPTGSNGGATMGASMGPSPANAAAAGNVGRPPYTGAHNTALQVAFLGVVAFAVIVLLRKAGFRFGFVAGASVGR